MRNNILTNSAKAQKHDKIRRQLSKRRLPKQFSSLDFLDINQRAQHFAQKIEENFENMAEILLSYESFEVVQDETRRTLDLLNNLSENKQYFQMRVGAVCAFLPRNQPLYALTCFVIVPSLMASELHFRIPQSMRNFFPQLLSLLEIQEHFPNIFVSHQERLEFLKERSAIRVNQETKESWPVTDAVIFTGTSNHADRLRLVFDKRTLFIANGSGHNPLIVAEDANLSDAVEAVLTLQMYNQGQDCAAPNAILVHKKVFSAFRRQLLSKLCTIKVGHYRDRLCRVGPISDPEDLVRIQRILIDNRQWLDPATPGVISSSNAIVNPTVICKPLKEGGNFSEVFAPIIFLQIYEEDSALSLYFENPHYALHAMYVTVYGKSSYADKLSSKLIDGKVLHDRASIIHNTHLHALGVERGTKPYGGHGYSASNLSIHGKILCMPTLPQRDIYQWIVKPLLRKDVLKNRKDMLRRLIQIKYKDVQKYLGMKSLKTAGHTSHTTEMAYIDSKILEKEKKRYIQVRKDNIYSLLQSPNAEYIARLEYNDLQNIRVLHSLLSKRHSKNKVEFAQKLYEISKKKHASENENRAHQLIFFLHVYQLLFGRQNGPRLANFLLDADRSKVCELLDV